MKEILKQLREENRYSQAQLANILGISRLSYLKYESGDVEPPVAVIRKLRKIYKISYEQLIDNKYKKKEVEYSIPAGHTLKIAEPEEGYSYYDNRFNYLAEQIELLKQMVQKLLENQSKEPVSDQSETPQFKNFDKTAFFEQVGKLNMDSSFISELRESSLI